MKTENEKKAIAALAELLAESFAVETHYNSEFYKARKKAQKAYKKLIEG
jgi:hypothetical protein